MEENQTIPSTNEPITSTQISKLQSADNDKVIDGLLTPMAVCFICILGWTSFFLGDVKAGLLSGKAETGWGVAIGTFIFGPILLIFGPITLLRIRKYKKAGLNVWPTTKKALLMMAVLAGIGSAYAIFTAIF